MPDLADTALKLEDQPAYQQLTVETQNYIQEQLRRDFVKDRRIKGLQELLPDELGREFEAWKVSSSGNWGGTSFLENMLQGQIAMERMEKATVEAK